MLALASDPPGTALEELALWETMRLNGSAVARERLFAIYLPFARGLAGRQFKGCGGADLEFEDFVQFACAGLLEAMDRYDPAYGVPFRGFATRRINGSIIDGLATLSEIREQIGFRQRVRRERARALAPDDAGSLPDAEAMAALAEMAVGLALGFMLEGTGLYQDGEKSTAVQPSAYDSLAWKDLVDRLTAELARLPERDRTILRLHYLEDVSFDQIARLLRLSKGRISQVHTAALALLRKRISGAGGFRLNR